jgi:hypothetical protein
MKKTLLLFFAVIAFGMHLQTYAQCTPGDSLSCPDPENNGEICPAFLPPAIQNAIYSEEVTILPPPTFTYLSATVPIHRIVLKSVDNLPPGMTYASNEPSGVFYPGTYYCVLLSGTPTDTGIFTLKIVVDAYILVLGTPVYAGEQIDSTSLSITVQAATPVNRLQAESIASRPFPNPFSTETVFDLNGFTGGEIRLSIYDQLGRRVFRDKLLNGEGRISLDGTQLSPGLYFYRLESETHQSQGKLIKQ